MLTVALLFTSTSPQALPVAALPLAQVTATEKQALALGPTLCSSSQSTPFAPALQTTATSGALRLSSQALPLLASAATPRPSSAMVATRLNFFGGSAGAGG